MATPRKEKNMSLNEIETEIQASEERSRREAARRQRLLELQKTKKQEEYLSLCRRIAEFVLDLSDLTAQPVQDFFKRMAEKKYEAAAKILTHELNTAAENAPARATRKDAELARKKGKTSTEMKTETGA